MAAVTLTVEPKIRPLLDPDFVPVALWRKSYVRAVEETGLGREFGLALSQDRAVTVARASLLPDREDYRSLNQVFVERLLKFLLWQKGGYAVRVAGDPWIAEFLRKTYAPNGSRAFDHEFMGERIYGRPFSVASIPFDDLPKEEEATQALGGHLEGCRIGFDLGGSDRKSAAVIDGEVVHSEEVVWDPYFERDPSWHYREINDSLRRAAEKLPRVDAIGGSAAGVYVDNQVRVASLFRGVSREDFDRSVRTMFLDLRREWGVPFEVVNDGEVTALAGSMALRDGAVLGIAMGTSLAAGYVTSRGHLTSGLDELAFVPVDYRARAPRDEWSGDLGVGAQYFSQQAVARLAPAAGLKFPSTMPFAEQLVQVQELMNRGDERARGIYDTIGVYLGYAVAQFDEFYDLRHVLLLGRVMTGEGGDLIVDRATTVLREEFPEVAERVELVTPSEQEKRHGQAVAAASLPELSKPEGD
jgi:predicted NBD/HSP70 family sugar kinase